LEIQRLSHAPTLLENGLEQVRNGRTTTSEILREAVWVNGTIPTNSRWPLPGPPERRPHLARDSTKGSSVVG